MNLNNLINQYHTLFFSFTKKVFVNDSLSFSLSTFFQALAQVFLVLAFFLPLKALILLGSQGIPYYLTDYISEHAKSDFILLLAGFSLLSYVLYLALDYFSSGLSRRISDKLLEKAKKISVVTNQDFLAKEILQRLIRSWSTFYLLIGIAFLILFLNWKVFMGVIGAISVQYYVLCKLWESLSKPQFVDLRDKFVQNKLVVLNAFSAIDFFIGFCILFYIFMQDQDPNLLLSVATILLVRQFLQRILLIINDGIFLVSKNNQIKALFYTLGQFKKNKNHHEVNFTELLHPKHRNELLSSMETERVGNVNNWVWNDSGVKNIGFLNKLLNSGECSEYWIKVYASNKKDVFQRESLLFGYSESYDKVAPAKCFVDSSQGLNLLGVSIPLSTGVDSEEFKELLPTLLRNLWLIKPPKVLANQLTRSIHSLNDRFTEALIEGMEVALQNDFEHEQYNLLKASWPDFSGFISSIPLFVTNGELSKNNVRVSNNGTPIMINWHKIGIEPILSNVSIRIVENFIDLETVLADLKAKRDDCQNLSIQHLILINLLGEFERLLNSQLYRAAIVMLPRLNQVIREV